MAEYLCDVCHQRPAAWQVTSVVNDTRQTLHVCELDYALLQRTRNARSPLEDLFTETPLSHFFDEFQGTGTF